MTICGYLRRLLKKPNLRRIPGRFKVRDASFPMAISYRMNGLFPGSITRTHPQWVVPAWADPAAPTPIVPGMALKVNPAGDGVLPVAAGDTATTIFGVAVRVYPTQPAGLNADLTPIIPPPKVDVLREGYIGVKCAGTPLIDGAAYVVAADASFSATAGIGPLTNAHFNGPPDVNGNAELCVTIAQH